MAKRVVGVAHSKEKKTHKKTKQRRVHWLLQQTIIEFKSKRRTSNNNNNNKKWNK